MTRIRTEGGISGLNNTPSPSVATGMWTVKDVERNLRFGTWPAATSTAVADAQFNLNSLLIHADGTNGANNTVLLDSSYALTPFSGTYSDSFNGSSQYLSASGSTFTIGTGNFTVEAWIYITAYPSSQGMIFATPWPTPGFQFYITPTGQPAWQIYSSGGTGTNNLAVSLNTWAHVAWVRSGSNNYVFVNGALSTTVTDSTNVSAPSTVYVGARGTDGYYFSGYISNFRFVLGTALYTTAFTPPSAPLTAVTGTLLLTGQSSTIIDNGPNALTITNTGTVTTTNGSNVITPTGRQYQGTFSPFSQTGWSIYAAARPQILGGPTLASDFTIEMWVNSVTWSTQYFLIDCREVSNSDNYIYWASTAFAVGSTTILSYTDIHSSLTSGWNHVAITRASGTVYMYLNGVLQGSASYASSISMGYINFLSRWDGTYASTGYISNFRVVNGTAVYSGSGSFAVPTAPLTAITNTSVLCFNKNNFTTTGSLGLPITPSSTTTVQPISPFVGLGVYSTTTNGGSGYFDGSTNYLTVPYNSAFDFAVGQVVSFEAWVYPTSYTNVFVLADRNWSYGGGGPTWGFSISNATNIQWAIAGTGSATYVLLSSSTLTGNYTIPLNAWTHVAFTRDASGNNKIFVNGYLAAARTDTQALTSASGSVYIGAATNLATGSFAQGYMSGLKLNKGTIPSLYQTSSTTVGAQIFTPPTSQVAVDAATVLYIGDTNAGIIDQTGKIDLTTYGSAAISTTQKQFGTGSVVFDGSTAYVRSLNNPLLDLSTGAPNFTVECWFYTNTTTSAGPIIAKDWNSGTTNPSYGIYLSGTSGQLLFFIADGTSGATYQQYAYTTISTGTWYHVAMVRNGSSLLSFVNGTLANTTTITITMKDGGSTFNIGSNNNAANFFNGYIDEVRITKGYARYTTNFTPTGPFLNQ